MTIQSTLVLITLIFLAGAVQASDQRASVSSCPADRPQRELMHCMSTEVDAADHKITDLLTSSIATLPDAQVSDEERRQARSSLLSAQAAWQEYREKTCTAVLLYLDDGDAGKLEYLDCKRRLAEQRLHDFDLFEAK